MMFDAPPSPFDPPSLPHLILNSPLKFLLHSIHAFITFFRSSPIASHPPIRIVCISDTHCNTTSIPNGDLLIHAGDLTQAGTPSELQAQITWLDSLPHTHKIAIAGNHDTHLDPRSRQTLSKPDQDSSVDWKSIHYLQHSGLTLTFPSRGDRRLRFFGAPQIPACGGPEFAFQYQRGRDAWTDTVPEDVDVLITHTPPKSNLDLPVGLGCEYLLREIWRVRPRLHVFGHVHAGRGAEVLYWDAAQRAFERGCGRPDGLFASTFDVRLWVCLVKVLVYGAVGVLWGQVWGGKEQRSQLVNAALMYNNSGQLGNEPQIVEI